MKALWIGMWVNLLCFSYGVQAAPPAPWLAVAEGSHSLSISSCANAAANVLQHQGFARVSNMGSTVMAAYRGGNNYQYKVAIKCQANSVVAFVVTTVSGGGLNKANSLIARLRQDTSNMSKASVEEDHIESETLPPEPVN